MLTLYVKTGCPFCAAVLKKLDEESIEYEERNIADETVLNDLLARGGKKQVPYLVDEEKEVEMYESADIIEYLDQNYSTTEA